MWFVLWIWVYAWRDIFELVIIAAEDDIRPAPQCGNKRIPYAYLLWVAWVKGTERRNLEKTIFQGGADGSSSLACSHGATTNVRAVSSRVESTDMKRTLP